MGLVLGLALSLINVYGSRFFSRSSAAHSTVLRGFLPLCCCSSCFYHLRLDQPVSFLAGSLSLG
jgi:hypothetical protein